MISNEIKTKTEEVDAIISSYLPKEEGLAASVADAMNYSIRVGGKRIRPMLMMETYRMFSGDADEEALHRFMAAIEMIHTYSLCHDDLPAMDDDDMRRGMPSTHAKYGEAMGILAGDALLNYAFETCLGCEQDSRRIIKALRILAQKSGIYGMIAGQVADIESEGMDPSEVSLERIMFIHENKTAAMIESSLMVGATLAGADDMHVKQLESVGSKIGLAFQIRDDILDVTGGDDLGKPVGSDERNKKATYVSIKGLDRAKADAAALTKEAIEMMRSLPGSDSKSGTFLIELFTNLATRNR